MILYAAADLLWASKIRGVADGLGIPARPVRTIEMLEARLADSPVKAVVVDLDKGEEGLALVRRAKRAAGVRVLAWGPHVDKAMLQAARDAGADDVLTRGAFEHSMEDVLLSLAGR